jgi:methionyl-tRNA formyltransferase
VSDKLRIIFAGAGEFGRPSLEALLASDVEVAAVITQPDRPAGRGRVMTPTPIGQLAEARGLPLVKTADINAELSPAVGLPVADVMVVIAFGQKIAPHVVNHPRLGSVNLHSSRLPKFRGAAPINWAILRGETETGNSIIRLAERMDAGAILGQTKLAIGELETAGELHDRLAVDGAALVLKTIAALADGTAVETLQEDSLATIAPKLGRQHSVLDFTRPAGELALQVRGLYPWPGCRVRLIDPGGKETARITLVRARPAGAVSGDAAPMHIAPSDTGPAEVRPGFIVSGGFVGCGIGALDIVEVQPEGKRPMPLSAFRNGHRWEAGMRLESAT